MFSHVFWSSGLQIKKCLTSSVKHNFIRKKIHHSTLKILIIQSDFQVSLAVSSLELINTYHYSRRDLFRQRPFLILILSKHSWKILIQESILQLLCTTSLLSCCSSLMSAFGWVFHCPTGTVPEVITSVSTSFGLVSILSHGRICYDFKKSSVWNGNH